MGLGWTQGTAAAAWWLRAWPTAAAEQQKAAVKATAVGTRPQLQHMCGTSCHASAAFVAAATPVPRGLAKAAAKGSHATMQQQRAIAGLMPHVVIFLGPNESLAPCGVLGPGQCSCVHD